MVNQNFLYIDPGTGSLLVYALVGIASSLFFILKGFFYNLYVALVAVFHKKDKTEVESSRRQVNPIVFYSEGNKYFHVFEPVIKEMIDRKVPCTYVTPDKNDQAFGLVCDTFTVICPGNDLVTIYYMNNISCDVVVSSTPHLDIYMWKRSKRVKKYVHIFHAPCGVDYYEKYALSFYDVILSLGDFMPLAQNYLDDKRHLPRKQYYQVGNTYYDKMVATVAAMESRKADTPTVLYAPTWGYSRSSFFTTGQQFVMQLLKDGYHVIFRPHPQFYTSHQKELDAFLDQVKEYPLVLDKDPSPLGSMSQSDILISDYSGIVIDFAYLFQKPILLSTSRLSSAGYEDEELPEDISFDKKAIHFVGHELTAAEAADISATVASCLASSDENASRIRAFRDNNIYHFGSAGKYAADAILDVLEAN